MNRFCLVAFVFSAAPLLAAGQSSVVVPTIAPVSCTPPLMQPLSVTPTVPPPVGTCVTYAEKRPGLFQSLLNCFRTPTGCDTCTPTSCPAPKPIKISPPKGCATDACATGVCPSSSSHAARPAATGSCWTRFKAWLCWKSCNEQLLPAFTPEPYRAPLLAYFPNCLPPQAGLPCGTGGHAKHGKKCATATCETPAYGPVVSPWVYAGTVTPATPVATPAPMTVPVPAANQLPANPIARPFTTP